MDTFSKGVYVREIEKQCRFALNAVEQLSQALRELHQGWQLSNELHTHFHNEVFRSLHSFLTHASNVSRLLWPAMLPKKKSETDEEHERRIGALEKVTRSRALRAEFGLADVHVLKNRKLRDHLEHFDERLDHWRTTSIHHNIVNDLIGPPNAVGGVAATDMMRWFDPTTKSFTFRGEAFNLQEIATALDELLPCALRLEEELWERQKAEARSQA